MKDTKRQAHSSFPGAELEKSCGAIQNSWRIPLRFNFVYFVFDSRLRVASVVAEKSPDLKPRLRDFKMSEPFYKRPLAGLLLLASATGGPYMLFETEAGKQASRIIGVNAGDQAGSSSNPAAGHFVSDRNASSGYAGINAPVYAPSHPHGNLLNPTVTEHELQQPVVYRLQDVLRFDIAPGWVLERFPRVTTVLADTQLDGLRVPLVTGTAPSDIAGTLTYNFDRYKRLQRLTVHGTTGDATRFIAELQQQYQLQQVPSLGGVLYLLSWNGKPTSIVHIEPAAVIYSDSPYARFNVLIELNQAGLEYGLSREARQLLDAGKSTQRW